jgi:hypothetical protein
MTNGNVTVTLGDLVTVFYEEYLALYGDEDRAASEAAATIVSLLEGDPETAEEVIR